MEYMKSDDTIGTASPFLKTTPLDELSCDDVINLMANTNLSNIVWAFRGQEIGKSEVQSSSCPYLFSLTFNFFFVFFFFPIK